MPNGEIHVKSNIIFVVGFVILGLAATVIDHTYLICFVAGYLFATFFANPDCDTRNNSTKNRWGVFQIIWRPYSHLFSHRGISHWYFVGTITRIVYLGIIPVIALNAWHVLKNEFLLVGFVGMTMADNVHIIFDYLFKENSVSLLWKK